MFQPRMLGLRINVFLDGLFHAVTYLFTLAGFVLLWRGGSDGRAHRSTQQFLSAILISFGLFNVAEGLVNHHLLQLHHVNETEPPDQRFAWDVAFLLWGAAMLLGGLAWLRRARSHQAPPD